jgi:diguanylate cyclase (GGDEF)-like protein/putative nucleotidyltransferase with HDIG domain
MKTKRFGELSTATKAYVSTIIVAGALTVAHSIHALITQPPPWNWTILALLTLVSGSATIKLPALPATISVSETFVFTSVLLFGVPAGTLTVALDALVISIWSYRRSDPLYKIFFNIFALPLTIWTAGRVFFSLPDWKPIFSRLEPLFQHPDPFQVIDLLGPLVVLAIVYFSLNSWLIAFAIGLERNLSPVHIWRHNFAMLSLNYFGGASVAALLVTYTRNIEWAYLALIVPLLIALYVTFSTSMGRVADANKHLSELNSLYMSTIETLAMAIDAKDQITHGHIRRVQIYAVGLAQKIGIADPQLIKAIEAAALLHDMGKLAVPEYILNKPGPLTPAEFEKMKLHASVGADILSAINFPYPVVPMVRHHHENWDGTGYPDRLAGTDIPIGARILSVVDCFDALTSDRPYRPRLDAEEAVGILLARKGSMYDPLVVDTFLQVHDDIAPEQLPAAVETPLRAITHASAVTAPTYLSTMPLEEIAASTEEMLALFHLASGLSAQMNVPDAADVIAKHLRRLVPWSLSIFFVYRVETDELVATHAVGEDAPLVIGMVIGLGERLSGWVAANRRGIRNSDPVLDLGELARSLSQRPRSCLSTPLISDGALVGVLSLYAPARDAFTEEHQRIVDVVSRQVSTIIKQASEFDNARQWRLRDRLTGLPNLEHLHQISSAGRSGETLKEPTSVILVEVVNLCSLAQRSGTDSTDAVLTSVAGAIRRSLRAADFLFKHGDHGFIVLLLQTRVETTELIVKRVREAIGTVCRDSFVTDTDVAIAMASAPDEASSITSLIERAHIKLVAASRDAGMPSHRTDSVH